MDVALNEEMARSFAEFLRTPDAQRVLRQALHAAAAANPPPAAG